MSQLIIYLPGGNRESFDLLAGNAVTLGRAEDNSVRIDDGTVSRHHARLYPDENGACVVEDLRSANGTMVNGRALEDRLELHDGDRLSFGEINATYQTTEADAARLVAPETASGQVFSGRYRLESALGETDEYHNFLAADSAADARRVSLKIFELGIIMQAGGFERVGREFARVCAAPVHPQLVRLLDFGRWRGVSFLAAEWIEGYPLLDPLRKHGALSGTEALSLARQAALATDHARAHALPAPDLDPRAVLVAFAAPIGVAEWKQRLCEPIKSWPPYLLKVPPRLFASAPPSPWPLGGLVYELLGHPSNALETRRAVRVPGLGEAGNATLAAGLASAGEAFGGDVAFIEALARDAGVSLFTPRG